MSTLTTPLPPRLSPPLRAIRLSDTVRAEWTRLRSVRSTFWSLVAAIGLSIGISAAISAANASNFRQRGQFRQLSFNPTDVSLRSMVIGVLAVSVLGVLTITSEYSSGMIRTSLAAVPRRWPLLASKMAVFAAVAFVIGEVCGFGGFLVGQTILSGGAPHATLGQPGVLRAVFGVGLYFAGMGLFALGLGTIIRSTAGAITATVAVVFALPGLAQALPGTLGESVREFLPSNAGSQIYALHGGSYQLNPWPGFAMLCLYAALSLGVAFWLFERRDA